MPNIISYKLLIIIAQSLTYHVDICLNIFQRLYRLRVYMLVLAESIFPTS
jgi:hypothetical protein